jgi:predicted nucleic acid-binding protein
MREKYIDHYGMDCLPNLKDAAKCKAHYFITLCKPMLEDRKELEKIYNLKIMSPKEFIEMDKFTGDERDG